MSNIFISLSLSPILSGILLDPTRDALQATADKWFHWLLISSGVVALGVALEAWEATISLKSWFRLKSCKEVAEPNEKSWAIPASYLGLLLVIAGVVGEGVFEGFVSNADTALQAHDSQILAQAEKDAGDAKLRAAELEQQIADRHVTVEQRKKMVEILDTRLGASITIWYVINSGADALAYTIEIQDVFRDAKWHVFHRPALISYDTPVHGFLMEVQHDSPSNQQVVALAEKALAVTGYRVSPPKIIPPDPNQDADVIVLVGSK